MYKVLMTELAEQDLDSVVSYISIQLANPSAAGHFLDEVEKCYTVLKSEPFMYEKSRDERLAAEGYRKAIIGSYVMLYKVNEESKIVIVYRFFYGPRDYTKLI